MKTTLILILLALLAPWALHARDLGEVGGYTQPGPDLQNPGVSRTEAPAA